MPKPKVLVFASGSAEGGGSGFENLVISSKSSDIHFDVVGVISNHESGGVRKRADKLGVPFVHFQKPWDAEDYQWIAEESKADYFALSGWLKLVKGLRVETRFNSQTVFNIHPGPLPRFGGSGLYGHHVHEAVLDAYKKGEITHSAVCMHFVTPMYDDGPLILQCKVRIEESDTPDTLAKRVNEVEHRLQPTVTDLVVNGRIRWDGQDPKSLKKPSWYNVRQSA